MQIEVQALLHDYLIDEHAASGGGSGSGNLTSRNPIASINEVLKAGRPISSLKDLGSGMNGSGNGGSGAGGGGSGAGGKSVFRFNDSDGKSSMRKIKPYEESLNKSLKMSVPGLVSSLAEGTPAVIGSLSALSSTAFDYSASPNPSAPTTSSSGNGKNARNGNTNNGAANTTKVTGRTHRMLIPPNAFDKDALVQPTMSFLNRIRETLPEDLLESVAGIGGGQSSEQGQNQHDDNDDVEGISSLAGLMDEQTLAAMRGALDNWQKRESGTIGVRPSATNGQH